MRDKADAVEFDRAIDTSHHSNIRVVIPPKVYHHLGKPSRIKFSLHGDKILVEAIENK